MLLQNTLVNCGEPNPPMNGTVGNYSHTRQGATAISRCEDGFRPSATFFSACTDSGMWMPQPEELDCTLVTGIF